MRAAPGPYSIRPAANQGNRRHARTRVVTCRYALGSPQAHEDSNGGWEAGVWNVAVAAHRRDPPSHPQVRALVGAADVSQIL